MSDKEPHMVQSGIAVRSSQNLTNSTREEVGFLGSLLKVVSTFHPSELSKMSTQLLGVK